MTRFVILVGPHDSEMISEISKKSGAKIQGWSSSAEASEAWNIDSIVAAIQSSQESSLLIMSRDSGLEILPISK